jgi:hypothetical protein
MERIGSLGQKLTPKHLLRQLEPSLFFKGQTTSLLASVTEKELVSELRGGMVHVGHPISRKMRVKIRERRATKRSPEHKTGFM